MIEFPETLPQPSTSFSGDISTPTFRTGLDNGLVSQYGRFSTKLETFGLSWEFSQEEFVIFEEWFNETLSGGVLVWNMLLPSGGGYSVRPVRFVGGQYQASHKSALWFTVSAQVECLGLTDVAPNRTLPVPQWLRLAIDPAVSQVLTFAHRNASLTVRPDSGSLTTLRISPPVDESQLIYFGINNKGLGDTLITSQDVPTVLPEAIPSFPGNLPNINQTFSFDAKRKATRIEMDSGHPRQYGELETTIRTYQVEWDFSLEELQNFQDFFFVTLKSGSATFTITLPVDGLFISVPVRFVGGKYSESYLPVNTFKVSGVLERIVDQTVVASKASPYPLFYTPKVIVSENRKVTNSDAGKLLIVAPNAGRTISLHIGSLQIEFGLLVKGLGNVLITRGPFINYVGNYVDFADSSYRKPTFELRDSQRIVSGLESDFATSSYLKPTFELFSTLEDIGSVGSDSSSSAYGIPTWEMKVVLKNIGTLDADFAASSYLKPSFELTEL